MKNERVLADSIEREKAGIDFFCSGEDRDLLNKMFSEINALTGSNYQYLAEMTAYHIQGSGEIIKKYITKFQSESVKGYLVPHLVSDRVTGCDEFILQLYLHFKSSEQYISPPGVPAPAHIYVRYDNAFAKLRSKRIKSELLALAHCPRDVFYLPFTFRMLATWRLPEMKSILIRYLDDNTVTPEEIGISGTGNYFPSMDSVKRELKFTAIYGLKYFPSAEVISILEPLCESTDQDLRIAAKKALTALKRNG